MAFTDEEFGEITVRKNPRSTTIKFSLSPSGKLRISAPTYVSDRRIKKLLDSSRIEIRETLSNGERSKKRIKDGQKIGKSFTILLRYTEDEKKPLLEGNSITVYSKDIYSDSVEMTQDIRDLIVKALRSDAKRYLPKKLTLAAREFGFSYKTVRLSHASSRWGSCSSRGTISLNISLMNLPEQVIDYVVIHELAHTKHMNHSKDFWNEVKFCDPNYKKHRKALKLYSPFI